MTEHLGPGPGLAENERRIFVAHLIRQQNQIDNLVAVRTHNGTRIDPDLVLAEMRSLEAEVTELRNRVITLECAEHKAPMPKRRTTWADVVEALKIDGDATAGEIAARFGCSVNHVHQLIHYHRASVKKRREGTQTYYSLEG